MQNFGVGAVSQDVNFFRRIVLKGGKLHAKWQCLQARSTRDSASSGIETVVSDVVDQAPLHGLFPEPMLQRELLRTPQHQANFGFGTLDG